MPLVSPMSNMLISTLIQTFVTQENARLREEVEELKRLNMSGKKYVEAKLNASVSQGNRGHQAHAATVGGGYENNNNSNYNNNNNKDRENNREKDEEQEIARVKRKQRRKENKDARRRERQGQSNGQGQGQGNSGLNSNPNSNPNAVSSLVSRFQKGSQQGVMQMSQGLGNGRATKVYGSSASSSMLAAAKQDLRPKNYNYNNQNSQNQNNNNLSLSRTFGNTTGSFGNVRGSREKDKSQTTNRDYFNGFTAALNGMTDPNPSGHNGNIYHGNLPSLPAPVAAEDRTGSGYSGSSSHHTSANNSLNTDKHYSKSATSERVAVINSHKINLGNSDKEKEKRTRPTSRGMTKNKTNVNNGSNGNNGNIVNTDRLDSSDPLRVSVGTGLRQERQQLDDNLKVCLTELQCCSVKIRGISGRGGVCIDCIECIDCIIFICYFSQSIMNFTTHPTQAHLLILSSPFSSFLSSSLLFSFLPFLLFFMPILHNISQYFTGHQHGAVPRQQTTRPDDSHASFPGKAAHRIIICQAEGAAGEGREGQ